VGGQPGATSAGSDGNGGGVVGMALNRSSALVDAQPEAKKIGGVLTARYSLPLPPSGYGGASRPPDLLS
jgi:hypothetical protein